MINQPKVKLGIVGVSRDCFPIELTRTRLAALMTEVRASKVEGVHDCPVIIENEKDTLKALEWAKKEGINAVCMFLGNFGPEGPTTLFVKRFGGPAMVLAAKEEGKKNLASDRGDALCGVLNFSYNIGLRRLRVYIPEYPNVTPREAVKELDDFKNIARVVIGIRNLKVIGFGPRPFDFLACNAPIQPLYDLGCEVQENSELDLKCQFEKVADRKAEIEAIAKDMAEELGASRNTYPEIVPQMAQLELALLDWYENNKGACDYVVFANKCWPAFPEQFGFEPCYVNSRLASRGIPVSCEVDIYGTLSEFIGTCITEDATTLLDINNTVPQDMYEESIKGKKFLCDEYTDKEIFMGFHCGNTASSKVCNCQMCFQRIMARALPIEVTNGTLEGDIKPGAATIYRLQSTADTKLRAYIAQGEVIPVATRSFGSIGIFGIKNMSRFYRHVLIEKHYPHHCAVMFGHQGKYLWEVLKYMGIPVEEIDYNFPKGDYYPTENPFC